MSKGYDLRTVTIAELTLRVGETYTSLNGMRFTITSIYSDRDGVTLSYRCADGALGDGTPNSIYWWINDISKAVHS
jgi:hypothetical protein